MPTHQKPLVFHHRDKALARRNARALASYLECELLEKSFSYDEWNAPAYTGLKLLS